MVGSLIPKRAKPPGSLVFGALISGKISILAPIALLYYPFSETRMKLFLKAFSDPTVRCQENVLGPPKIHLWPDRVYSLYVILKYRLHLTKR